MSKGVWANEALRVLSSSGKRADPPSLHTYRHGALEERDRDNQLTIAADFGQKTLDVAKGALLYDDTLSNFQERPWLHEQPRPDDSLERDDFTLIHRARQLTYPDDFDHTWRSKHGYPVLQVKIAKQIAWKERQLQKFKAVRPPTCTCVEQQQVQGACAS